VENIVQATARDILAHGKMSAYKSGLDVILSVHDELVVKTEFEDASYNLHKLIRCMTTMPTWATSIPVRAVGYVSTRYRKD
jgi:DNA polymerase